MTSTYSNSQFTGERDIKMGLKKNRHFRSILNVDRNKEIMQFNKISSRMFYRDIYLRASSINSLWILKPWHFILVYFNLIYLCIWTSYFISKVGGYFFEKAPIFTMYFKISLVLFVCTVGIVFYFTLAVRRRMKKYRLKRYLTFLSECKKGRCLDAESINELIWDVEALIEIQKIYAGKLSRFIKNITIAVFIPILIYGFKLVVVDGSYVILVGVYLLYFFALVLVLLRDYEIFESARYIFVKDVYMLTHVKKELEFMKTIKINSYYN